MNSLPHRSLIGILPFILPLLAVSLAGAQTASPSWMKGSIAKLETELIDKYGEGQRARLQRGMRQVKKFWRQEDGGADVFEEFVRLNFAGDQATIDEMFNRFELLLEQLDGHMNEIKIEFQRHTDLDLGRILPFDQIFAGYDPKAHIIDDFFKNKLAFTVLLNFPMTTLARVS